MATKKKAAPKKKAVAKKKAPAKKKVVAKKAPAKKKVVAKKAPAKKAAPKKKAVAKKAPAKKPAAKKPAAKKKATGALVGRSIAKRGLGEFTIPGLMKITTVKKPAKKSRKGINPFTGEEQVFKAKPASMAVKVRPLKKLKEFAAK